MYLYNLGEAPVNSFDFFVLSIFDLKWLFHQSTADRKKWFFRPLVMSFGFLEVIFGRKGLEIDTYKPSNFTWSYHTHMVNTTRVDQTGPERQN